MIEYAINFYSDRLLKRSGLLDLLAAISLTHKGLTEAELLRFSKVTYEELQNVLRIFGIYIMCYKGYYICHNEVFRRVVEQIYYPQPEHKKEMHKRIALIFEKAPNNVRKLEEEATHFYQAEEFFSLKQIISTIENFLMLFNPITKFDLFRYWRRLEQKGYDPVIEYNKGVEQFDTQYIPEPDRLFVIILQVCRFLKEFSDFETDVTPVFRHPLIKGKIGVKTKAGRNKRAEEGGTQSMEKKTVAKTGGSLANVIEKPGLTRGKSRDASLPRLDKAQASKTTSKKKGILQSETTRKRQRLDPLGTKEPFYDKLNELSEIEDVDDQRDRESETTFNYLEKIGLLKELKQFSLTHDTFSHSQTGKEHSIPNPEHLRYEEKNKIKRRFEEILEEWEDVNVENPAGRERFRTHFLTIFNETMKYKAKPTGNTVEDNDLLLAIQGSSKSGHMASQDSLLKVKSLEIDESDLRHEYQTKIDLLDLEIKPEKEPSYYYYKRWIWIMFPWVCMSISNELNFSEVISKCYSSATKYMNIEEENEFYRSRSYLSIGALEIAIEYKLRKEAILAKQGPVDGDEKPPEEIKQEKIKAKHEEFIKQPPPDYRRTFTNLVVKKEEPSKSRIIRTQQSSRRLAPLQGVQDYYGDSMSQMKVVPRLKHPHLRSTLAVKDTLFLTGVDGSEAQNESSSL